MKNKNISHLSILIVIAFTAYIIVYSVGRILPMVPFPDFGGISVSTSTIPLRTPEGVIRAIVASTSADRERGLSGRESLDDETGMLFIFPNSGVHGFWMKDMNFAIDMIWIDSEKRVSSILSDVSPDTYPEVFSPQASAMYVLELSSGGALKWGIATGTQLVF